MFGSIALLARVHELLGSLRVGPDHVLKGALVRHFRKLLRPAVPGIDVFDQLSFSFAHLPKLRGCLPFSLQRCPLFGNGIGLLWFWLWLDIRTDFRSPLIRDFLRCYLLPVFLSLQLMQQCRLLSLDPIAILRHAAFCFREVPETVFLAHGLVTPEPLNGPAVVPDGSHFNWGHRGDCLGGYAGSFFSNTWKLLKLLCRRGHPGTV